MRHMRLQLLIYLLLILPLTVHAQFTWERYGNVSFRGIHRFSDGRLLMCTNAGSVYRSADNGATWSHEPIDPLRPFTALSIYADSVGLIGATQGDVFVTLDGGLTWTKQSTGFESTWNAVVAPSRDTFFASAAAGMLIRSTDRGLSWELLTTGVNASLTKLAFSDAQHGVASGDNGTLIVTSDGGTSWSVVPSGITGNVRALDCRGQSRIAIGTSQRIHVSSDGGVHWSESTFPDSLSGTFTLVKILTDTDIIALQIGVPYLFCSKDFGSTWIRTPMIKHPQEAYVQSDYYGIAVDEGGNGFIVGQNGTIVEVNGGTSCQFRAHWALQEPGKPAPLVIVKPSADDPQKRFRGIGYFGKAFILSNDGGATWLSRDEPTYGYTSFLDMKQTGDSAWLIINRSTGSNQWYPFYTTTDEAQSWNPITSVPRTTFHDAESDVVGNYYLFADSTLFRTSDNGVSWNPLFSFSEKEPRDNNRKISTSVITEGQIIGPQTVYFLTQTIDSVFGWANPDSTFRNSQYFTVTHDNGQVFERRFVFPENWNTNRMTFLSPVKGFVVVAGNIVNNVSTVNRLYKTTDGGYSWIDVGINAGNTILTNIVFQDSLRGAVASFDGSVFFTADGGETWTEDTLLFPGGKRGAQVLQILYYKDSSIILNSRVGLWTKSVPALPSGVTVSGRTPNPFLYISLSPSPADKFIQCSLFGLYSLNEKDQFRVTVYDILGKKMMDLGSLARDHSNGSYSTFVFSTTALPNGPYILSLETDNGSISRRFIISR